MNIELLKTFIYVAESKSLTHASHKLYKTQSSVTKSIKKLEEMLDIELFDRTEKKLKINRSGKQLLSHAYKVLQSKYDFFEMADKIRGKHSRPLVIAFDSILPFQVILNHIDLSHDYFQNRNIKFSSRILEGSYELVEKGEAKFAITCKIRESGELHSKLISTTSILCCVNKRHTDKFWKTIPQCVLTDEYPSRYDAYTHSTSTKILVKTIEEKISLIIEGKAWGRVPASYIDSKLNGKQVLSEADVPGIAQRMTLPIYMVYNHQFEDTISSLVNQ